MLVGRGCDAHDAHAMEVWEEYGLGGFSTAHGVHTDLQTYVKCFEEDVASYGHRIRLMVIGHVLWL